MNLKTFDKAIIGTLIILIIYLFYKFSLIYNVSSTNNPFQPIGEIQDIFNSAKKRTQSSLNWFKANPGDTVSQNDYLFTGDDSALLITFDNGSQITIESNSLVLIKNMKKIPHINLEKGRISSKNTKSFYLTNTSQKDPVLFNAISNIVLDKKDQINFDIISGKAKITNIQVSEGSKYNITDNKLIPTSKLITITSLDVTKDKIFIEWSKSDSKSYIVTFFDKLKKVIQTETVYGNKLSLLKPPNMTYLQISDINQLITSSVIPILDKQDSPNKKLNNRTTREDFFSIYKYYLEILELFIKVNSLDKKKVD